MTKSPLHRSLIVPVNCSCSGDFYQHNASYTVNASDTYFSIANNIYQGLTTCQALKAQNPSHNSRGHLSEDIDLLIPLRCACPVDVLISSGYNYLLSYIINMGENISSIAQTFHGEKWTIYADIKKGWIQWRKETLSNTHFDTIKLSKLQNKKKKKKNT